MNRYRQLRAIKASLRTLGILLGCLALFLGSGCAREYKAQDFVGHWVHENEESFLEFLPSGVLVIYSEEPRSLEAFHWTLEDQPSIRVKPLARGWLKDSVEKFYKGEELVYSFSLEDKRLSLHKNGRVENYRKTTLSNTETAPLLGLWSRKYEADEVALEETYEFTPWGTLVILTEYLPDKESGNTGRMTNCDWHRCEQKTKKIKMQGLSLYPERRDRTMGYKLSEASSKLKLFADDWKLYFRKAESRSR